MACKNNVNPCFLNAEEMHYFVQKKYTSVSRSKEHFDAFVIFILFDLQSVKKQSLLFIPDITVFSFFFNLRISSRTVYSS